MLRSDRTHPLMTREAQEMLQGRAPIPTREIGDLARTGENESRGSLTLGRDF